jgi:antitoxin ParD1/3/4
MAAKHSRHIALTGQLADYVASQVSGGQYASVSDMVRTALHLLKERDEASATRRARRKTGTQPVRDRA